MIYGLSLGKESLYLANMAYTVDSYWNIIKHLSPDAKLDLIALLTKSLKKTTRKRVSAKKHYGVWGDDGMTDEEFVDELKSLRRNSLR